MRGSTNSNGTHRMEAVRRSPRGVLLLEAVLALAIAGMLLVSIMWIVDGALDMSNGMAEDGRQHMTQEAFLTFLDRNFNQLPGNAEIELERRETGTHWLSDLTFQNVPTSFSWSGQAISAEAVQISTVPSRTGDLDIVLRYYEEAILDDSDSTANLQAEPVAQITLLQDVYWFEWYARDGRSLDYTEIWDVRGRLPVQLELRVKFDENSEEIVHHFWIPPKLNPETVMRSQRRAAPAQRQSSGGETRREGDRNTRNGSSTERPAASRPAPPGGGGNRPPPPGGGR